MTMLCCELVRRGRYVAAEPWISTKPLIALANPKKYHGDIGKLAIVATVRNTGMVVEVLGDKRDERNFLRGLLAERGIFGPPPPHGSALDDFPRAVQQEIERFESENFSSTIPESMLQGRTDLRSTLCVTIDPVGARDHDDAVCLTMPDEGDRGSGASHVLWVHIADVAAFVTPGSALDTEAYDRAMSVYVPGMVVPMLPELLSSDLCSLLPGRDRLCFSVRLALSDTADVLRVQFARTIIRSAARLHYDQVDGIISDGSATASPAIDKMLNELNDLTSLMRKKRMDAGALDMALPEVEFELDYDRRIVDASLSHESASHRLIEECMLAANLAVGSRLAKATAPGLWRVHPDPDPAAIERLLDEYAALGVPTPAMPDDCTAAEASRVAGRAVKMAQTFANQRGRGSASLPQRCLRALQQASYSPTPGVHSGLAMENYAHFTSPIRRYPDLVNHRSLLNLIGADDAPPATVDLEEVATHTSFVERELISVERDADRMVLGMLLRRRLDEDLRNGKPTRWQGEITGFSGAGCFVRFGEIWEGFIPARTISKGERFEVDERRIALVGTASGTRLTLGDRVNVVVHNVRQHDGRVDLRLARQSE